MIDHENLRPVTRYGKELLKTRTCSTWTNYSSHPHHFLVARPPRKKKKKRTRGGNDLRMTIDYAQQPFLSMCLESAPTAAHLSSPVMEGQLPWASCGQN